MKLKKQSLVTGGSLASALLSFLPLACCIFPTALAFLGAGSLAFAASLMPYRGSSCISRPGILFCVSARLQM